MTVRCVLKRSVIGAFASASVHVYPLARLHLGYIPGPPYVWGALRRIEARIGELASGSVTPPDQVDRETSGALLTRNLLECCDDCRELLREQLEGEERREG